MKDGRRDSPRILVTVGTDHHPFDRLIVWFDEWLAASGFDPHECLVQCGTANPPAVVPWTRFLAYEEVVSILDRADVVVTHGGPGTISECRARAIRPVVVPRRRAFGEAVDDHQVSFTRRLAAFGAVDLAETPAALGVALDAAVTRPADRPHRTQSGEGVAEFRVAALVDALIGARSAHRSRPGRVGSLSTRRPAEAAERGGLRVEGEEAASGRRVGIGGDVTKNDLVRSRTVRSLPHVLAVLRRIGPVGRDRMLDVGCGFGGLTKAIASALRIDEVHGIDVDEAALEEAASKGVITRRCDVGSEALPYPDAYFDLVTSFGMLDYLPFFDDPMGEFRRVLKPNGVVVVSLPNLASWNNRVALLLGYQPRDIEFSASGAFGVHPYYRDDREATGHLHTVTAGAFREFAEHVGFRTVTVAGLAPPSPSTPRLLRLVDDVLARRASLAKRFLYVGRRSEPDAAS